MVVLYYRHMDNSKFIVIVSIVAKEIRNGRVYFVDGSNSPLNDYFLSQKQCMEYHQMKERLKNVV